MSVSRRLQDGSSGATPVGVDGALDTVGEAQFDFVHIGESNVASAVNTHDGYKHVLVLEDDLSGFACLAPAKAARRILPLVGEWGALCRRPHK